MSYKERHDWTTFSDGGGAFDLFGKAFRRAMSKDAYANRTVFRARALTDMFPLSANQSMAIDGGATGTAEGANRRFAFKARILGSDSPHVFLPDVCDPAFAADEDYIYKVIAMHTTFISTNVYEGVAVTRGDMVLVELEKSGQTYNLEYGMFKTLLSAESPTATAGTACSSLANLVGGWEAPQPMQMGDVPVDGGTVSAGGASPRKCSGTEFCTQFIQAKHYRAASRTASDIRMVVVHATAGKGGTSRAIGGATRMAKGPTHAVTAKKGYTGPTVEYGGKTREACRSGICKQQGKPYQLTEPPVSAHYFVDQGGNIVQGVADKDIAYHGSNTNSYSIGIEHTLTTKDPAEYTDVLYDAAAKLGAKLAIKYDIPVKRTTDQKGTGFIAHSDISQKNPHADPGDLWDWDKYMKKIQHYVDNPGEGLQEAGGSSEAVATADDKCKDHPGSTYFAGDEEYYEGCYNGEEWAGYAST